MTIARCPFSSSNRYYSMCDPCVCVPLYFSSQGNCGILLQTLHFLCMKMSEENQHEHASVCVWDRIERTRQISKGTHKLTDNKMWHGQMFLFSNENIFFFVSSEHELHFFYFSHLPPPHALCFDSLFSVVVVVVVVNYRQLRAKLICCEYRKK